ncbi:MAG: M1 family peptidase [Dehalococcoidia bacterium]|nr:M1 family peptidase [Dehalococcoidia bacterium]MSQ16306.1 M1 family peptidase [Dehalococcoidia bacterium]
MPATPAADTFTLPTTVRPSKYRLTLTPDLEQFTFTGQVSIDVEILRRTQQIVLNADELELQSAVLVRPRSRATPTNISFDADRQTVTLDFGKAITPGKARLDLEFTGTLNDQLRGFYRSQYTTPSGRKRTLAATQFEATDARRAFPCWDEPAIKASFECALIIPQKLVAVSNTPVVAESPAASGKKTVRFDETPVMSTYLLAFVVGDLMSIHAQAKNGTKVSVWTTRGKEEQGRFALETSVRLLGYFNDYFGIPYPLPKLDHIAIPDFSAGAMENWGAITYRETALLVDPVNSSAGTRQRVAEVVSHEMAHMWFGDLVTMAWWDDLWLNESFASWMGDKAVDWAFPEWQMWTQFVSADTNRALSLDGLKNSHPVQQEVKDPAQVSELFDAISYSKGGSLIRMVEQYLGPETFRQGLHQYLSAHQYGNARTQDLWAALEATSKKPVTAMMNGWTQQVGYPVLQVQTSSVSGGLELNLSQERFTYDRLLEEGPPDTTIWQVPVAVTQKGGAAPAFTLMDRKDFKLRLEQRAGQAGQWLKVNPQQTGFFRVNYQPQEWERLVPAVRSKELTALDRLGLQNDAFALSRAGLLPVTQFLSLAQAYDNDTDATVWGDLASNLREIDQLVANQDYYVAFQALGRRLFGPAARRAGWDARPGEGHLDSLLRSTVLGQAGSYGDPEVLEQAKSRFVNYVRDPSRVHPDIRGVVVSLAGQTGDRATYDQLWGLERKATLQEEKIRLLMALTRFSQPELLQQTLERALSSEVRAQDTISVVTSVAGNSKGRELAWQFLKDQWPEFDRRYGKGGFGLMRLVGMCGSFSDEAHLAEVEQFFQEHPAHAAERTIRQVLERIRLNIKWLERNEAELAVWLRR